MARERSNRPDDISRSIAESVRSLPSPVNWRIVLDNLIRFGWRLQWIADAINAPASTVHGWFNDGSRPEFEYGRALLALHAQEEKRFAECLDSQQEVQTVRQATTTTRGSNDDGTSGTGGVNCSPLSSMRGSYKLA